MANNNVVVVYDQLQSALTKLDNYYTMLEEQQQMISRLNTYFDHLYEVHGKNTTFVVTMEDKIEKMSEAVKNDLADIDYLKNMIDYIIQSYTDAEGKTTLRSNELLMTALGSLVPYSTSFATNIYGTLNDYAIAVNSDASKAADVSQYSKVKDWITYKDTNAQTADAWDAIHNNISENGESHSYKLSTTGSKISTAAQNVTIQDAQKDIEAAEAKLKEVQTKLKETQEKMERTDKPAGQSSGAEKVVTSVKENEQKVIPKQELEATKAETKNLDPKILRPKSEQATQESQAEAPVQEEKPASHTTSQKETPVQKQQQQKSSGTPKTTTSQKEAGVQKQQQKSSATTKTQTPKTQTPTTTTQPTTTEDVIIPSEPLDPIEPATTDTTVDTDLPTPQRKSTSGNKVVPIIAGVAAAGAAGVGAKVILDKKTNNDIDDDWDIQEEDTTETTYTEDNMLDSSDEFTYKTDIEDTYSDVDYADDTFGEVSEEEDVQGYQAINFNDISETH